MIWIPKNLRTTNKFKKKKHLQLQKQHCVYLSHLPQSLVLFVVDMSLHAGLPSADEYEMPQGESSKRHRHRAAGETVGSSLLVMLATFFSDIVVPEHC